MAKKEALLLVLLTPACALLHLAELFLRPLKGLVRAGLRLLEALPPLGLVLPSLLDSLFTHDLACPRIDSRLIPASRDN
jgi:hypothetical protein